MCAEVVRRGPLCRTQYLEWWQSQCLPFRTNANLFVEVDFPEGFSPQAAETATRSVLARHEAFRTTFGLDESGMPQQLVHPAEKLPPIARTVLTDPGGRQELVRELRRHEFGPLEMPVAATIVLTDDDRVDFLVVCCSHLACDYYSLEIIRKEILALLESQGPPDPSALPDRGPQPLDIALAERIGEITKSEGAAIRHWTKALSTAPLRTFWRSYPADTEIYQAKATSYDAPIMLSRYALSNGCTPSIVYTALVHVMMSLLSGSASTLVRFYFTGRSRRFQNVVGPFHRHLFSTLEIADSDTLSECVRRAARVIMAARARYAVNHLAFREAEIREEANRGSSFAWGTVVNVLETAEFLDGWRKLPGTSPRVPRSDYLYPLQAIGPDANERGMEVFLSTLMDPVCQGVQADYNSLAFSEDEAEILVRGPWDILRHSLANGDDPTIADLRKQYGSAPSRSATDAATYAAGLRDTEVVLERFPGVTASFLTVRQGGSPVEVVAYVAVDKPQVTTEDLRDHVLASLRPSTAVICPSYFIICDAVPPDRADENSWRTVKWLSEGTGVRGDTLRSRSRQETALLQAIMEVDDGWSPDLARSYIECGGALLKVPAILRRLTKAGFAGLHTREFEGHARLYQLAARLHDTDAARP
jgi:Condensation domain